MAKQTTADSKEEFKELISRIIDNEEIQWKFHRSLVVREILTLWVTVRGFSITAPLMETYKKETKKIGLRKGVQLSHHILVHMYFKKCKEKHQCKHIVLLPSVFWQWNGVNLKIVCVHWTSLSVTVALYPIQIKGLLNTDSYCILNRVMNSWVVSSPLSCTLFTEIFSRRICEMCTLKIKSPSLPG